LTTLGQAASSVNELKKADAKHSTIIALTKALEAGGVQFIEENGGGAGVRLKKPRGRKKIATRELAGQLIPRISRKALGIEDLNGLLFCVAPPEPVFVSYSDWNDRAMFPKASIV